jgi:hypothetical protein
MPKLTLDLSALRVESFAADAPAARAAGTVLAHAFTIGLNCPETNYRTCPHTCAAGC